MAEMYTSLLEWRRNEATSRLLARLPADYYTSTSAYLSELRRSYEAELRENPSARKGEIARQTYQRASQLARDILESRSQKLLTFAFQSSIGAARDLPNSLTEEKAVFDELLGVLLTHRQRVAPYLEPGAPASVPAPRPPGAPVPTALPPTPAAAKPAPAAPVPRTVGASAEYVRVVGDHRTIEAGAETIDLAPDDVLSLPPDVAKLLVDAKVAERLTVTPPRPAA